VNALLIAIVLIALQGFKTDLPKVDPDAPKPPPPTSPPPPTCNVTQGYYQPTGGPKLPMDTNKPIPAPADSVRHNTYFVQEPGGGLPKWVLLKGNPSISIGKYNPLHYTTGDCK